MRNRWLVVAVLLVILALDGAALHDILAGEPDVWMEWTVVALSAGVLAWLVADYRAHRRGVGR